MQRRATARPGSPRRGRSEARRAGPTSSARSPGTAVESPRDLRRCHRGQARHSRDADRRPDLLLGDRARPVDEVARASPRGAPQGAAPRLLTSMALRDLREWIALLEREGELHRVTAEVDPHLEITEIVDRTVRAGGPALLFEHPKGSRHPLLINQFGTERRMCLAFGVERLDDVAAKLADVLELQPPEGLAAKVRGLRTLKSIADSRPKVVRRGACQEVVVRGDEVDLSALPVMTCWPGDAAPFITLPAVITHDPRTGTRNVGMYRMQVLGPRSTAMHWQLHKDGRADFMFADGRLEVAVALGLDPISAYSASAPLPKHIDELMLAGFLRGDAVELVKGVSVDLEVPADAEIVLEGYV